MLQGQDQRERIADFEEVLRTAIAGMLLDVMTAMPVQIVSFDPATMTASAQPVLNGKVLDESTGLWVNVQQQVLIHCPVIFMGGGGFTVTAPVAAGDEALAVFSHRSIDEWWVAGGIQSRASLRSHSISDGFIIIGPRSQPRVLSDFNTTALEIRSDDGATKLSIGTGGIVTVTGSLGVTGGLSVSGGGGSGAAISGPITVAELGTTQTATPSFTSSDHSIPVKVMLGGVATTMYMRLSSTP